ncbi:MAG: VOC family protein [Candidatus Hydrogenedentes bacterium]|nr:VOC family protein [Candidatus Hydrogenedentota bacterium]
MTATRIAGAAAEDAARFHHVHINTTDQARSMKFYEEVFGAVPVKFMNRVDALFTERSFLLFNVVEEEPRNAWTTGIWHIGWGGVDVAHEFQWWKKQGVPFHTELQPLPGEDNFYMYIKGPDQEAIEINTMGHHRFAHVHLFADDVNATSNWYADHLGLASRRGREVPKPAGSMETLAGIWMNFIQCGNVNIIVFGKPDQPGISWWPGKPLVAFEPTRGHVLDHLAFSYRDIGPVYERMKAAGLNIVEPIAVREPYGMKSFFVLGPEQVLLEIVEAKPIPEGVWE